MRLRDGLSAAAGLAAIAVAVLVVGGAFRWVQAIVAGLLVLAIGSQLLSRRALDRVSPLIALLTLAAGLTAIQLIPLPTALLDALQPASALRDDGAALVGVSPWRALTSDAPGSLRALGFFVILIGIAWISLRMTVSERGRYRVLAAIAILCGVTALITGLHELVGAERLYGLYSPVQASPSVLGPLLNENHLGGLMAIGTLLAVGLVMYERQPSWARAGWFLVIGACGATTVASQSRGATLALIAGAVITAAFLIGQRVFGTEQRRSRARFVMSSLPIGVVALCTVIVVIYASAGGVSTQLSRTTLSEVQQPKSKFAIWRSTVPLIEESPWVGVGRGGFESAFTRVHPAAAVASFSHAENEYVQAVVDWGIPGALLLGLAATWGAIVAFRRWRDGPLVAGALGAIVVVVLQSIVDFGIEMPGLAAPVTAIVATVTYVPLRDVDARKAALARVLRVGLVVALATVAALFMSTSTTSIAEDHQTLSNRKDVTLAEVTEVIERHPLDYYGYALASQILTARGDGLGIRVLNHALRLHPTHPGLHHLAAALLFRAGQTSQATIEYAAAMHASTTPRALLIEIVNRFPTTQAAEAIPADFPNIDEVIRTLTDLGRPDIASAWLVRVLDARPGSLHACEMLFSLAVRQSDLAMARAASTRCAHFDPTQNARVDLAAILLREKAFSEVITLLHDVETWPGVIDHKISGWLIVCDAQVGLLQLDAARRCLRRLDMSGLMPEARRGDVASRLARIADLLRANPPK